MADNEDVSSEEENDSALEGEYSAVAANVGVGHLLSDSDRTSDEEFQQAMMDLGVAHRRRVKTNVFADGIEVEQLNELSVNQARPEVIAADGALVDDQQVIDDEDVEDVHVAAEKDVEDVHVAPDKDVEDDCSSVNGGMKMVTGFTPRPWERFRGMLIVEDDGEEMGLRWWDDGEVAMTMAVAMTTELKMSKEGGLKLCVEGLEGQDVDIVVC
ncbi:hypothetical protein LINGRAHAP2_LOCUS24309 [Linum grandiflorum]